jgi:2-hydroxychromene-2-carboxylate isomerase
MAEQIDYYLSLNSPWSYMGHERLAALAKAHGLSVHVHPVDFGGVIFPATGGLPVGKRSPQRQAYRLVELERWRKYLDIPLNIHPRFWPADEVLAAHTVLAARDSGADAVTLAGALLRAVWAQERNIADRDTLLAVVSECGLDGESLLAAADSAGIADLRAGESRQAIEHGVFGAPTYIYREQPFWGQDRLELLEYTIKSDR